MELKETIEDFVKHVIAGDIEVYNEFSLQHELGIFLRGRLTDYKIQFERNTKSFNISNTVKHEIDIVVFNDKEKYAIELKYPQNGQYPEQMFSFVKDIKFMEMLVYILVLSEIGLPEDEIINKVIWLFNIKHFMKIK